MSDDLFNSINGLGEIADRYDAILCDIWGVIHNGRAPYHDACEALERFRTDHGPVVMISNTSQPSASVPESFLRLRMPDGFYDAIVTSGDATVNEIARRAPGPVFLMADGNQAPTLLEGVPLHFSDLEGAQIVIAAGHYNSEAEVQALRGTLDTALDQGLSMICTNPDVRVKMGERIVYCPGAVGQLYESMGGKVIYGGKPHAPIYNLASAWLDQIIGHVPAPERILCIGDNIFTDLIGAQREGFDCLFIQDGLYGAKEAQLTELLSEHGISARYIAPKLDW